MQLVKDPTKGSNLVGEGETLGSPLTAAVVEGVKEATSGPAADKTYQAGGSLNMLCYNHCQIVGHLCSRKTQIATGTHCPPTV